MRWFMEVMKFYRHVIVYMWEDDMILYYRLTTNRHSCNWVAQHVRRSDWSHPQPVISCCWINWSGQLGHVKTTRKACTQWDYHSATTEERCLQDTHIWRAKSCIIPWFHFADVTWHNRNMVRQGPQLSWLNLYMACMQNHAYMEVQNEVLSRLPLINSLVLGNTVFIELWTVCVIRSWFVYYITS